MDGDDSDTASEIRGMLVEAEEGIEKSSPSMILTPPLFSKEGYLAQARPGLLHPGGTLALRNIRQRGQNKEITKKAYRRSIDTRGYGTCDY
jgi:hypothetical protein